MSNTSLSPHICSVCISEIDNLETAFKTYCDHYFHPTCISPWLLYNSSCPNCRQEISFVNENLFDYFDDLYNSDEFHEDLAYSFMIRDIIHLIRNINNRITNYYINNNRTNTNNNNNIFYVSNQLNNIINNLSTNNTNTRINNNIDFNSINNYINDINYLY